MTAIRRNVIALWRAGGALPKLGRKIICAMEFQLEPGAAQDGLGKPS